MVKKKKWRTTGPPLLQPGWRLDEQETVVTLESPLCVVRTIIICVFVQFLITATYAMTDQETVNILILVIAKSLQVKHVGCSKSNTCTKNSNKGSK